MDQRLSRRTEKCGLSSIGEGEKITATASSPVAMSRLEEQSVSASDSAISQEPKEKGAIDFVWPTQHGGSSSDLRRLCIAGTRLGITVLFGRPMVFSVVVTGTRRYGPIFLRNRGTEGSFGRTEAAGSIPRFAELHPLPSHLANAMSWRSPFLGIFSSAQHQFQPDSKDEWNNFDRDVT